MHDDPKRNPYLLLGIPFGTGREEANAAFVRAVRRARRTGADPTDLTWALNRIDDAAEDPALDLSLYRVPASAEAFRPEEQGSLHPGPERMAARHAHSADALRRVREQAALECLRHLVVLRGRQSAPPSP